MPMELDLAEVFTLMASVLKGYDGVARETPDRIALRSAHGDRTFGELAQRVNRLTRALGTRGLQKGDGVAVLCSNRPEFVEAMFAAEQGGFRFTPINWHLRAAEISYILRDCGARAFIADSRFATEARDALASAGDVTMPLAVGGGIEGFDGYEEALQQESPDALASLGGGLMLYTSGTTGRPKGVRRDNAGLGGLRELPMVIGAMRPQPGDVSLCTGPLYHGANLGIALKLPLSCGVGVVLMDGFDPEEALRLIAEHRIAITHMVPTMFQRMLALDEGLRARYDVSSIRFVMHGGAPCPVAVKRAMLNWFGPSLYEYYGATEGFGTFIGPAEWERKPGSVGRVDPSCVSIRDESGQLAPPNAVGDVFLVTNSQNRFVYHNDQAKTDASYHGDWFTLGDLGSIDEDGYLTIHDRTADVIISGGVNIYPAEIDAILLSHPAVQDAVVFGVADEEWGESVHAVVELKLAARESATSETAASLIAFCRTHLAKFKCPRTLELVARVPRDDSGKSCRRRLRDDYRARGRGQGESASG